MNSRIRVSIDGHVAVLTLVRPEKLNALDGAMFAELTRAGEEIRRDQGIRAVILHGEGAHFCAGVDISELQDFSSNSGDFARRALALADGEMANEFQKCTFIFRQIEVPVIAAINGAAFGGGCQLALAADLRFAAPDARLSIVEIKWGLVPDMGLMTTLPYLVRMDTAKELVWSGRIVESREALELGLITSIHDDPVAHATETARQIAARSPDAIRGCKRLLQQAWGASPAVALRLEAEIQSSVMGGRNQVEAVAANLEKRVARFD